MATLPTNYQDAVWTGSRKYTMEQNADDTVSFSDATEYTVEGSFFGAGDINRTNTQVNGISGAKEISIATSAWSSSTTTVNGNACTCLCGCGRVRRFYHVLCIHKAYFDD